MKQVVSIYYPRTYPEKLLIRFIWSIRKKDFGIENEKILPKGTAEIIFNLNQNNCWFKETGDSYSLVPECIINGLNTSPQQLISIGSQNFIGIQLNAFALKYLFDLPAKELMNRVVNGFDISLSLQTLCNQLCSESSFNRQIPYILGWINNQIKCNKLSKQIERCPIFNLHNHPHPKDLSIKSICRHYNITDRHLRRLCNEFLGLNAEEVILYRKYLGSLGGIHQKEVSLTEIAYNSGFFDQSHFIREFKAFTGFSPGAYRNIMSELPGHLYNHP